MTRNISGYDSYKSLYLTVLKAERNSGMDPMKPTPDTTRRTSTGVSFGTAVGLRTKEAADIKAVALRYDNFEEAVLPMVLAADRTLSGTAAKEVAQAILGNEALRGQAERAYNKVRIGAV